MIRSRRFPIAPFLLLGVLTAANAPAASAATLTIKDSADDTAPTTCDQQAATITPDQGTETIAPDCKGTGDGEVNLSAVDDGSTSSPVVSVAAGAQVLIEPLNNDTALGYYPMSVAQETAPGKGSLTIDGDAVTYQADSGADAGVDAFDYRIQDGAANTSNAATVYVEVTASTANETPSDATACDTILAEYPTVDQCFVPEPTGGNYSKSQQAGGIMVAVLDMATGERGQIALADNPLGDYGNYKEITVALTQTPGKTDSDDTLPGHDYDRCTKDGNTLPYGVDADGDGYADDGEITDCPVDSGTWYATFKNTAGQTNDYSIGFIRTF